MRVVLLLAWWLATATAFNYNFVPFTSQSNCLTMAGNSNDNDATFSLAPCSPTNNYQKFTFGTTTTYLTTFRSANTPHSSNMCLDVVDGTGNEVRITQTDCDPGKKSQYWVQATAPLAANGYYWYKNFATGRCMTAELLGAYVDQYDCTTGALHQIWTIGTDPFTYGQPLKNQLYGNCMQVNDGNPYSGAATSAGLCSATAFYQHFEVTTQTPNTWKLIGSNKCLDGGSTGQAYQWDCVASAYNQQWLAAKFPNEGSVDYTYQVDLLSGLCLTWTPDNLANVHLETCVQWNTNQQWKQIWV